MLPWCDLNKLAYVSSSLRYCNKNALVSAIFSKVNNLNMYSNNYELCEEYRIEENGIINILNLVSLTSHFKI